MRTRSAILFEIAVSTAWLLFGVYLYARSMTHCADTAIFQLLYILVIVVQVVNTVRLILADADEFAKSPVTLVSEPHGAAQPQPSAPPMEVD